MLLNMNYFLILLVYSVAVVSGAEQYCRDDFPSGFVVGAGTSAYQVEGAADEDGRTPSIWDTFSQAVAVVSGAEQYSRDDFPPAFVFGAGTSAYQVEGAADEDGRTPSIWDTFSQAGKMHGATGDIACDGYHKYKEDVQLMVDTNLEAYRFSISWSRLIPNGRGPVNPKGLQFYNNLINELIRNGIQPHVTLHHSDLPQALEDEYGGWISGKIIKDFTAYAEVCFREFGDRVLHWTTINEADVFVLGGYDVGLSPPQRCSSRTICPKGNSSYEPYVAAHNIILSHSAAAKLFREKYKEKQGGFIGLNLFSFWFIPFSNSTADIIATRRANDFFLGWYLHPLVYGEYPSSMKANAGSRIPGFTSVESELVKGSFDFIGINYYNTMYAKDNPSSLDKEPRDFNADMSIQMLPFRQINDSSFEYPLTPWGLKGVLEYVKQSYNNPPVYIHENGQRTRRNSSLQDWPRVESLSAHIGTVLDTIWDGSDIRGYFTWSFLDLFEMLDGYESGYGLYFVDLDDANLARYPKLSAKWYSQFLRGETVSSNGSFGEMEQRFVS